MKALAELLTDKYIIYTQIIDNKLHIFTTDIMDATKAVLFDGKWLDSRGINYTSRVNEEIFDIWEALDIICSKMK